MVNMLDQTVTLTLAEIRYLQNDVFVLKTVVERKGSELEKQIVEHIRASLQAKEMGRDYKPYTGETNEE